MGDSGRPLIAESILGGLPLLATLQAEAPVGFGFVERDFRHVPETGEAARDLPPGERPAGAGAWEIVDSHSPIRTGERGHRPRRGLRRFQRAGGHSPR